MKIDASLLFVFSSVFIFISVHLVASKKYEFRAKVLDNST
jgi:hypothetical protein